MKMGTQGSLIYYENRDLGPHFSMKMGTRGPQFGGSLFSYDTCHGWKWSSKPILVLKQGSAFIIGLHNSTELTLMHTVCDEHKSIKTNKIILTLNSGVLVLMSTYRRKSRPAG